MERYLLQAEIREYMLKLRQLAAPSAHDRTNPTWPRKVIFTEVRQGYLDGQRVERLVLFLRGTGCSWAARTGGCTFCGFWSAANFGTRISARDYYLQVTKSISDPQLRFDEYPIICLYNDGSLLDDAEINSSALLRICQLLARRDHVKRIVIESKLYDLCEEKILWLAEAMNSKELEIAVGFESANDIVRDLCVNKSFSNEFFEAKCRMLKRHGVRLVPLIIVKPPFLTERQAIDDVVNSLQYLEQFELQRIDLELATVEAYTLMQDLWEEGLYSTLRLWSIVEILGRKSELSLKTPVFVSPPNYTVESLDRPRNCPHCTEEILSRINEYNDGLDVSFFDSLTCSCKQEWENLLRKDNGLEPLIDQVENIFRELLRRKNRAKEKR